MKERILVTKHMTLPLLGAVLWVGFAAAEPPQALISPIDAGGISSYQPASSDMPDTSRQSGPSFWVTTDYLLWFVKPDANRVPLVTTSPYNPNTYVPGVSPVPGALTNPSTTVLFGGNGNNINYGTFSGLRLQGGMVLDPDGMFGVEAGGFLLEKKSSNYSTQSDPTGQPFLGRPVIGSISQTEGTYAISFANDAGNLGGGQSGSISINSSTRLWGTEANTTACMYSQGGLKMTGLLGARYVNLDESLGITDSSTPIGQPAFFTGNPVPVGDTVVLQDHFRTNNNFFGGQVGTRVCYCQDNFDVSLSGKCALGDNMERLSINGSTTVPCAGQVAPGGLLAQPSNIGVYHRNEFCVVPEVGANLGYQLTNWMRFQVGYSFLFMSSVMRPDGAIDRVVDQSQVPSSPFYSSSGLAGTRPVPLFNQDSFFAHGVNFGLQLSY